VKAIVPIKVDLQRQTLSFIDPAFTVREQRSAIFAAPEAGKPSLHITAFADPLDRQGVTGNVVGVLTLKVPGLQLDLPGRP
jgi:hypothetical protein